MANDPSERTSWWHSIVTRITVVFALLVLLSTVIAGYLVYQGGSEQMTRAAQEDMGRSLQLARLRLSAFARTMQDDINFLSSNPPMRELTMQLDTLDSLGSRHARDRVAVLLESFLRSRPLYAQVRVIGADSLGKELVRFDRTPGGSVRVPDSLLQAKGDREYYRSTMELFPGQRYFSAIDLNKEHGQVQLPRVPTLRAAAPLFTPSGKRAGIAIINADLRPLFAEIEELQGPHEELMMADERGELLLHPDTARAFAFEFGRSFTLKDELGGPVILDSALMRPGRMLRFEPADIEGLQRKYTLGIAVRVDDLLAGIRRQRDRSLLISLAIAGVFALFSLFFAQGIANRLSRLTRRVERYAAGSDTEKLPIQRRDEIGRLSRSLERMQQRIDQRVAELEQARHTAEEADRLRREFLANMSHEVRTPLSAIIGLSEGVDGSRLNEADRERLAIVHRSAQRLKGLVDDLLLHARIGEGKLELRITAVDVQQLVNDIAQAHRSVAEGKGIALRVSMATGVGIMNTDALRVYQVLDNLVGNAVKYTREGQVDIDVRMTREGLQVEVSDSGPGLSEEEQQRIFERFERAASAENDSNSAGLGLAITRRLVTLLGGSIAVQSGPGKGARFTLVIPSATLEDAPILTAEQTPEVPAPEELRGLKVLYVEDVATNRLLMEQWAAKWGWAFSTAASAEDAITVCEANAFDLLLLDMDLGEGMRGSELALRLRGLKRHRYTPMIAVTAYVDDVHEEEALRAGMNDRITKPIDRADLIAKTLFWCVQGADTDASHEPTLVALEAQYDNDREKVITALKQYRREFTDRRLALRKAIAANDMSAVTRLCHQLRPHWELLGLQNALPLLDTLEGRLTQQGALGRVEEVLRRCDRAMMRRQRELLAATAGPTV